MATQVPTEMVDQLQALEQRLAPHTHKPKCEWPLDIMTELHNVARRITKIAGKELYVALQWPDASHSDPSAFYPGPKNRNANFTRPQTSWLAAQGYSLHKTTYTCGNRWDRVPTTAAFYIPNTLRPSDAAPMMWYFHGGGYCTGANDVHPWFSKASMAYAHARKAVIIAPDYPLGPEGNYTDVVASINGFLAFFKNDTCFEPDHDTWTHWLQSKINIPGVTLHLARVLLEGESAGGLAATTALFLNADKASGAKIRISAALLRFPMLAHYERSVTAYEYMGRTFTRQDVEARADRIQSAEAGYLPTRVRSAPPECMSAAFILSVTGRWKGSFQRAHYGEIIGDAFDGMDGIERARRSVERVEHALLPLLYMYHGGGDENCRVEKTLEFEGVLREMYGGRYCEGMVRTRVVEGEGHGFDYELGVEGNRILRETYEDIERHW